MTSSANKSDLSEKLKAIQLCNSRHSSFVQVELKEIGKSKQTMMYCNKCHFYGAPYGTNSEEAWQIGQEIKSYGHPPNWLFSLVCFVLYFMMTVSIFIFWQDNDASTVSKL